MSMMLELMRESTSNLLGSYTTDRSKGAESWKQMQETIAAIRGGEQVTSPKRVEKKAPEVKAAPAVVKELPVFEEKAPVVAIEVPAANEEMTLEDKIFQYINNHLEGVKVSDMEEPLHETRMKIGFAAKCLLDAGKVSKIENLYYPVKKSIR